jgi:hypothetical protein
MTSLYKELAHNGTVPTKLPNFEVCNQCEKPLYMSAEFTCSKVLRHCTYLMKDDMSKEWPGMLGIQIPEEYIGVISREVMTSPFVASDGNSYDLEELEGLARKKSVLRSPLTREELNMLVYPNYNLRSMIRLFVQENGGIVSHPTTLDWGRFPNLSNPQSVQTHVHDVECYDHLAVSGRLFACSYRLGGSNRDTITIVRMNPAQTSVTFTGDDWSNVSSMRWHGSILLVSAWHNERDELHCRWIKYTADGEVVPGSLMPDDSEYDLWPTLDITYTPSGRVIWIEPRRSEHGEIVEAQLNTSTDGIPLQFTPQSIDYLGDDILVVARDGTIEQFTINSDDRLERVTSIRNNSGDVPVGLAFATRFRSRDNMNTLRGVDIMRMKTMRVDRHTQLLVVFLCRNTLKNTVDLRIYDSKGVCLHRFDVTGYGRREDIVRASPAQSDLCLAINPNEPDRDNPMIYISIGSFVGRFAYRNTPHGGWNSSLL